jgi:hypothetical protein
MALREISRIISVKPEPQTTPTLDQLIQPENAQRTVNSYRFTPTLRGYFKRIFECAVHEKGQGLWVQAEYGAGKTHFLGTLFDLLVWRDKGVWEVVNDSEIAQEYGKPLSKAKYFPVAFSLRGMGESGGGDSLMRIFEEQIKESIARHAPHLLDQVKVTSAELADSWYAKDATTHERAAVASYFQQEHKSTADEFRSKCGSRKFGQEIVKSGLVEGRLRGKFKERFAYIYEQLTKLGGHSGMIFVVDEFRSWQDRHVAGTAAYAEDEEILETLAFVLPSQNLNIVTIIASQGDMPQKLSGGGQGDRFIPLPLLADQNKTDFGEIVVFCCRELNQGAEVDINDYYDHCRKEYKFIRQSNISRPYFNAIFPFQPRCFDLLRRITQSDQQNNLPTIRSGVRMAWQAIGEQELLAGHRLVTISDLIRTDEMQKGLSHETYREGHANFNTVIDQLSSLDLTDEERGQAQRILETLYLWSISVPSSLRDGLTSQEIAEAAWLSDEAVGSTAQADRLLERLVQNGYPVRVEKKSKEGQTVSVYSYELVASQELPVKYFSPLKKKAKEDAKAQEAKWVESLFWQPPDITKEAQEELSVNGGIFWQFQPPDSRTAREKQEGKAVVYEFPYRSACSTRRLYNVAYGGEVVLSERWRVDLGQVIKDPDQHFRLVYLTADHASSAETIKDTLEDSRVAICFPASLSEETREALADMLAAEQMKRNCSAPNQSGLRDYAEGKRKEAVKAILKCQIDEYRRGKVITQKGYAIPAAEVFLPSKNREEDLAKRLLEKAYDTPLFSPKDIKKEFTDNEAKKLFGGLFHKEPAKAEKDAVLNFGVGLELATKSHPADFNPDESQALAKIRDHIRGRSDIPHSELKTSFCCPPYGLTESMVSLYAFALVKFGRYQLVLRVNSGYTLNNGNPVPNDELTAHHLSLCDWNAKLDKAMLGARLMESVHKGWNDVLPYARVLDPSLKPAANPDEELERNDALLGILTKLKSEIPDVKRGVEDLAAELGGRVPDSLQETFARFLGFASVSDYREFDAAARESYSKEQALQEAYADFEKARRLRELAFQISQIFSYLNRACNIDNVIDADRDSHRGRLKFESLLANPTSFAAVQELFERWKPKYVQAYRKGHRAYYEKIAELSKALEGLRPKARALGRLNEIVELGPPLANTADAPAIVARLEQELSSCPDAKLAALDGKNALCPKCSWAPDRHAPEESVGKLATVVNQGLSDRMFRFKDAAISSILKRAADEGKQPGLTELLEIIQVANSDKLADVLTDELVAFLRRVLYDESIVSETIPLAPIVRQVGAIDQSRISEALEKITSLLSKAFQDARAKHGHDKRVRIFLTLDEAEADVAIAPAVDGVQDKR